VLGLPVYDSQCGAKLIRADLVPSVFDEPFTSRWLFDVEILARLRNRYGVDGVLRMVREVPLGTWTDVPGSKVRSGHMLRVPYEFPADTARYGPAADRSDLRVSAARSARLRISVRARRAPSVTHVPAPAAAEAALDIVASVRSIRSSPA
jgi:hypothetical protein